jgi:hypothetical protein
MSERQWLPCDGCGIEKRDTNWSKCEVCFRTKCETCFSFGNPTLCKACHRTRRQAELMGWLYGRRFFGLREGRKGG